MYNLHGRTVPLCAPYEYMITGGNAPNIPLGFYTIEWVNWWTVFLGLGFVLITIVSKNGLIGFLNNIIIKAK